MTDDRLLPEPDAEDAPQEDMTPQEDPGTAVYRLSSAAFTLAQEAAAAKGDAEERNTQARAMNAQLDALWPIIQAGPAMYDYGLNNAWSDARLDLGYVLSGGELSPSIRLASYLQSLPDQPEC